MATNDSSEFDPVPGYTKPTHEYGQEFGDEFHAPRVLELLKSYARFTQRGVTLAGGQGVIATGTVLAQNASDGKYYVYAAAGSGGKQNALGVLRDQRDTTPNGTSTDCLGNLVISGVLDLALLSGTDTTSKVSAALGGIGSGTTGVITQLNARVDSVNGLFIF